ncbi:Major facilitator superfamily domain, general substrate transporter [Metarhizium album ARSEF 1941]|uniref:Major facilitator superfamily domain, general substrate transporter n=1 Tax=Metarhizium album (strain ARSEF 1941) TaxID=1081103 RepID=A0A0B2WQ65_METAS|nr:Major facilitator superfamily domain, general substrate transporter [Metarhizium album ARSEF 1941]KHN98186.1 Major facilitator superfamily domain, general substrate transporter [Metarhizium album ARSEF 1941]
MPSRRNGPEAQGDRQHDSNLPMAVATETTSLLGTVVEETGKVTAASNVQGAKGAWNGLADFEGLPWWRKPSVFWLLAPYSVFTLAFGSVIVPKLNLILDLVCQHYFASKQHLHPDPNARPVILGADNPQCRNPEVQKRVAAFMLAMSFCTGLLSAYSAPRLGQLSDRYGRRRLLALASCGGLLGEFITILAAKFPDIVDYRWLMLGSIFDGVTGSFTAGHILTQSYTSDCTPPSRRAVAIGYIHACLFTGLAAGQLLGGEIVRLTGSLVSVFYVCLAAHSFFIVFVAFVIPDSLSGNKKLVAREKHRKEEEARRERSVSWVSWVRERNPFSSLSVLWPRGQGTSTRLRLNLLALATCDMVIMGTAMATGQVIMLYAEYVFGWQTPETSRFVAAASSFRVVVLMGFFPFINYFFRVRPAAKRRRRSGITPTDRNGGADHLDIWILRIALVSDILGYVGYSLARAPGPFVACAMVTAFGGLGSATSQSVITKHVPHDRVGSVLGAIGMLQALVRVIGPVAFNGLYAATVGSFPQAIFVAIAGLFSFALVCSFIITPFVYWHEDHEEEGDAREPLN